MLTHQRLLNGFNVTFVKCGFMKHTDVISNEFICDNCEMVQLVLYLKK